MEGVVFCVAMLCGDRRATFEIDRAECFQASDPDQGRALSGSLAPSYMEFADGLSVWELQSESLDELRAQWLREVRVLTNCNDVDFIESDRIKDVLASIDCVLVEEVEQGSRWISFSGKEVDFRSIRPCVDEIASRVLLNERDQASVFVCKLRIDTQRAGARQSESRSLLIGCITQPEVIDEAGSSAKNPKCKIEDQDGAEDKVVVRRTQRTECDHCEENQWCDIAEVNGRGERELDQGGKRENGDQQEQALSLRCF